MSLDSGVSEKVGRQIDFDFKQDNVQANIQSLSNAVCFKRHNNVCACAVSALILHLVANLSPDIDPATTIFFMTRKF